MWRKMINYELLPEFEKDFKALLKRFQTLDSDFERFKKFSIEPHFEQNVETTSFVKIEGNCGEKYSSYKVRKFACRALMGKGSQSGIRIIFIWEPNSRKITFVEMYFKGDKALEDKERLKRVIKGIICNNSTSTK